MKKKATLLSEQELSHQFLNQSHELTQHIRKCLIPPSFICKLFTASNNQEREENKTNCIINKYFHGDKISHFYLAYDYM